MYIIKSLKKKPILSHSESLSDSLDINEILTKETNVIQGSVLVIGGGVAGIQTSLDLTELGFKVYLVEKSPSIGGRMAQLDKTFPTNDCSLCILAPKMVEVYRNPNIELLTYHEIKEVSGNLGNFHVTVLKKPRYVDETKCKGCGDCSTKCPNRNTKYF